ncbi:unnamed protein product [Rotaria magnacalcarata]|uniref:Uncharacterized protein n=1 Tax=Rotaria magnacalcarata TaxID=392030 RepID=A0A8S3HIU2_9BILA|nr:unnamed protein product [Rotaria magnacalcarata]
MILDTMIADESLPSEKRLITRNTLLLKHIHQHDKEFHRVSHTQESKKLLPFTHSFAELTRNRSQKDITPSIVDQMPPTTPTGTTSQHLTLTNRRKRSSLVIKKTTTYY